MINKILRTKTKQTIFTVADISDISGRKADSNLVANINYYVKKGDLIQISKGLYAIDRDYDKYELGNKLRRPSYVSFYTVLQKEGILFQEYQELFFASNRSEQIEINNIKFKYRKLKDSILLNNMEIVSTTNISIATIERALCDKLYLDGEEYFDNLTSIDWEVANKLAIEVYKSEKLIKTLNKLKDVK